MNQFDCLSALAENLEFINKLKELPIFSPLDPPDIKDLLKLCKLVEYEPGEMIYEENMFDNRIFLLLTGKVNKLQRGMIISIYRRAGDVFGEMGIIDCKPRSSTVQAVDKTRCLVIDASYLERVDDKPKLHVFYRIFTEVLSHRLRATTEELIQTKEELGKLKSRLIHNIKSA